MSKISYICQCCDQMFISLNKKRVLCRECISEHIDRSQKELENFLENYSDHENCIPLRKLYLRLDKHDKMLSAAFKWIHDKSNTKKWSGIGDEK